METVLIIINGNSRDRVFHVTSENPITVDFNYLTIENGNSQDTRGGGGGICIECAVNTTGAYINYSRHFSMLIDPYADVPGIGTPDENIERATVNIRHVEIRNNEDRVSGGGIMNSGILNLEDSVITKETLNKSQNLR